LEKPWLYQLREGCNEKLPQRQLREFLPVSNEDLPEVGAAFVDALVYNLFSVLLHHAAEDIKIGG
jgi:hypothetical protein